MAMSIATDARLAIPASKLAAHGITRDDLTADITADTIMWAAQHWGWAENATERGYWGQRARYTHRAAEAAGIDTPAVRAAWDHFLAIEHAGLTGTYR